MWLVKLRASHRSKYVDQRCVDVDCGPVDSPQPGALRPAPQERLQCWEQPGEIVTRIPHIAVRVTTDGLKTFAKFFMKAHQPCIIDPHMVGIQRGNCAVPPAKNVCKAHQKKIPEITETLRVRFPARHVCSYSFHSGG
jgi:hypothetical protein